MSKNIQIEEKKEMKGIILAGGTGSRLYPLTKTTSKQLLPVYNCQMIFYPLNTLIKGGIREILIIVAPGRSGDYLNLLGSILNEFGVKLSFMVQDEPRGLPEAFTLGEGFMDEDNVTMILGDNIFEDDFSQQIKNFQQGAHLFATKVHDPERFGVAVFDESGNVSQIVEKPQQHISDFALTGLYIYDHNVVEVAKNLKQSVRGEYEIVDLHNHYLKKQLVNVTTFDGAWFDAGTFDSLLEASVYAKEHKLIDNFDPIVKGALAKFNEYFE